MQVHHDEGVATHIGPESCAVVREGLGEALTWVRTGQPSNRERMFNPGCRRRSRGGRQYGRARHRERSDDSAWSETLACAEASLRGSREISRPTARQIAAGPHREGEEQ